MNLEKLISKYLDGELSLEEDQYLRSVVASDPEAKSLFEQHIELSYSLKNDASDISTPEELKDAVEDKILMRIMSETQFNDVPDFINSESTEPENKKKRRALILIPVFLVGFLALFFSNSGSNKIIVDSLESEAEISSIQLEKFEPYVFLEKEVLADNNFNTFSPDFTNSKKVDEEAYSVNREGLSENSSISLSSLQITERDAVSNDIVVSDFNDKIVREIQIVQNNNIVELTTEKSVESESINNSAYLRSSLVSPSANFNPNFLSDPVFNGNLNDREILPYSGKLEFSSIAGSEMMQGGYSPTEMNSINNFAQSIAFRFSENQKVGLEIGFNEYTFSSLRRTTIPFPELNGYEYDPTVGDVFTRDGISTMVNTESVQRNYWAVVFAEKRLIDYYSFDFSGRVGFGATNSGPLAYGRLLGNYRIVSNISLSAGLDFRMFQSNLSAFIDQSNGFKGTVSFVYGLNINF